MKIYEDLLKLFANRMVNGILLILQCVEKDVDCPTHKKSITLDWSEAVTDIFPNKAETSSMISTVRNKIKLFISDDQFLGAAHFLCKSGHKAINKRGRLGRSPTIRCTSQGWTEPKTECVKVSVLTAR